MGLEYRGQRRIKKNAEKQVGLGHRYWEKERVGGSDLGAGAR